MRAATAVNGTDLSLYITQQIVFSAGFFAIISVSFDLLKKWFLYARGSFPSPLVRLIYITLIAAVALSITGGVMSNPTSNADTVTKGTALINAGRWLFFSLTCAFFVVTSMSFLSHSSSSLEKVGVLKKDVGILAIVGALLNIKSCFSVSLIYNSLLVRQETYFYPLSVMPELLILCLYCVPTLVARFNYPTATTTATTAVSVSPV